MNIGSSIESLRKLKNISQKELSIKAQITQSYLSLIENNKKEPNLKTLKDISVSLDVPLPFLFLMSMDVDDIAENKKETFLLVMPLVKSLLNTYIHNTTP